MTKKKLKVVNSLRVGKIEPSLCLGCRIKSWFGQERCSRWPDCRTERHYTRAFRLWQFSPALFRIIYNKNKLN